ncbi:MAG: hypothetical protein AAFR81_24915 [Chloroflexota bacterium]
MRSLSKIDAKDKELLADKLETVMTAIVIEHPMAYMEVFGEIMHHVLNCYGGYVSFEYHLFDIANIKTIQDYTPYSPSWRTE